MKNCIFLYSGEKVIIDPEDFEYLNQFSWCKTGSLGYPGRFIQENGKSRQIALYRQLLEYHGYDLTGLVIDHKNRDILDNRKENLRICTQTQNRYNAGCATNKKNGIKGVYKDKADTFRARIKYKGKNMTIKHGFPSLKMAGIAYDLKARELFGEFAYINFPDAAREEIQEVLDFLEIEHPFKLKTSSRFLGVYFHKANQKWRAAIKVPNPLFSQKKSKHIGYFDSEEEAKNAYNKKCFEIYGKIPKSNL